MYLKKTLKDIDIKGKTVLLRLDLNVPISDNRITDNNRIVQCLPTLNYLLENECKVIVLSHFSRIKSLDDIKTGKKSLFLVAKAIKSFLSTKTVSFIDEVDFEVVRSRVESEFADIFVLENTRYYDVNNLGEVVKWESKNFPELAKFWGSLGDVFVNDAFGTSHRSHASNVGIAENTSESCVGFLVEKEIEHLSKALDSQEKPKVLILGGSKVSDKLKLIKTITPKVDKVIIGGGMSYTFLSAMGLDVGKSLIEKEMIEECKQLLVDYKDKLAIPVDHVVADAFADKPGKIIDAEQKDWGNSMALDIGPKTVKKYQDILEDAKVVIWNGPMGVFEFANFENGTKRVALKLAEITKKGAYTVIGGGDSASAAKKFKVTNDISFISTGGGASLCFFEGSKMPGLDVIPDRDNK